MFDVSALTILITWLIINHVVIIINTIYVHRGLFHNSVTYNHLIEKLFRLILWLTSGCPDNYKIAIHRKHHHLSDQPGDPTSPQINGWYNIVVKKFIKTILFFIFFKKYGTPPINVITAYKADHPDDFFTRSPRIGRFIFLLALIVLFGTTGFLMWISFYVVVATTTILLSDCLSHTFGYRNFTTNDASKNPFFFGLVLGGEELHNNHHQFPKSAKFSHKWFELDIGYLYIKCLQLLRLATLRNLS